MRHPEHDRLREEVRSWYRTSIPELGYHAQQRRFGSYRRHAEGQDSALIIVDDMSPDEVTEFLADASSYFEKRVVNIWIEDKKTDATIGPALVAAGASKLKANVHLAHVGARLERFQLSGVTIERVTANMLMDYVLVKLKGFANSEDAPPVEEVEKELAVRQSELASMGRFLIARVDDEPAAILGYYDGRDRLIFSLATRMPFRMRGVARRLLCQVVAESYEQGCSSVVINTDPDDTPIKWYQRIGFTDEVYWRRDYRFAENKP
jgi:ribosomal protein S18 acetylase RimI-like enzyme